MHYIHKKCKAPKRFDDQDTKPAEVVDENEADMRRKRKQHFLRNIRLPMFRNFNWLICIY